MSNSTSRGLVIDAKIVAPDRHTLKRGPSTGLIRLEVGTTVSEVRRLISVFPNTYNTLLNPQSYGNARGQSSASVHINLEFAGHSYRALLKVSKSRRHDLLSGRSLQPGYQEPWIPCGPVIDSRGCNVKLSGALVGAGFGVQAWTTQVISLGLPARPVSLQQVSLLVRDRTWKLDTGLGLPQSTGPLISGDQ